MTNFRKRKMQHCNFIIRFWNHVEKSQEKEASLRALKGSHNYNRSTLGRCFAINSHFPCSIFLCIFHILIINIARCFFLLLFTVAFSFIKWVYINTTVKNTTKQKKNYYTSGKQHWETHIKAYEYFQHSTFQN